MSKSSSPFILEYLVVALDPYAPTRLLTQPFPRSRVLLLKLLQPPYLVHLLLNHPHNNIAKPINRIMLRDLLLTRSRVCLQYACPPLHVHHTHPELPHHITIFTLLFSSLT